jgi:RNA ligase (TIGR02306 family)
MRKLASIQKIIKTEAIAGADAIEKAKVLGWELVIKKGEFKAGDLCVYCEIDCLMPDRPEFEFLKPKGMRIKTVRLRGQISQGICLPLSILPDGIVPEENLDVTEILGIEKYEPPIPANLGGVAKGMFPGFIPKTDETRVQVLQEVLDLYAGETCYVTEKLDGSSSTFYLRDGVFGVCSRNLELLDNDENSMWKFAKKNNLEEKLKSFGKNIALQGEIIGEGIQKNKYKLNGQSVRFFNVFDIDKFEYFSFDEFRKIISGFGLQTVPLLEENFILSNSISSLVEKSVMRSTLNKDAWAEGIVIRPLKEKSDNGKMKTRISFKAINPEFLIRYGE